MKFLPILFFALLFIPSLTYAQVIQPNSLSVSPSLLQLDLAKDTSEANLTYTNTTSQTLEVSLSASDFAPLEDGYKISFLSQKDADNYKYSLSSWVDFSEKTILIPPNSKKTITVFIAKDKLTSGGHYATILAQMHSVKANDIQINSVLASLLFVRTNSGKEIDAASIVSMDTDGDLLTFPSSVTLRINNTGDSALTPYGLIQVKDSLNREVARGILNTDSQQVLPESIRSYTVRLRSLTLAFLPGRYHVVLTMHYGKKLIYATKSINVLSQGQLPYVQFILIIAIFLTIGLIFKRKLPRKS